MNKIFILEGQNEGLLAVLSNDNSGKCPFFDAVHTEQLNKDHTFEFSVPADHEASARVKENNLVVFKDEDGSYQLFQIYKIEEEHNGLELTKRAYAEHSFFEMNDDIIEDLRTVNGTAESALTDALSNSRFKVGTVADLGLRTTNFYYESAVSSIQKIIQAWGGELKKRINFDGSRITERLVDLPARRGSDTGKRFEYTKDLLSIKRTVDASNVKTALYGRGKGEETEAGGFSRRLTFADVIWSGSGLDPVDKPSGQEWVGDPEALEQFGRIDPETGQKVHRFGVFEDGQETDAEALLQKTWNALQGVNAPKVTYEMNVLDLETVSGLSHEKVRLGDTVFVIDKEFVPELRIEARIIEIKRDLANPENTEIILGNFLPMFTDLASRLKNIESKVDGKEGIWDETGDLGPIDDSDFADITPAKPTVTVTGAFSKVIIEWNADTSAYLKEYEVYVSTVPGFTPDASNLVARIVASVFTYEGEPNQQYYVRVRGVNRAGTAGPFSDEKSAQTARIGSADLSDLLITAEKLATGAITNDKLDRTSSNKIVIDSADIKNAAVGSAAIANLAVNTGHIQNLAVTNAKIANLAVDTAKIADLAVTNAKIGNISATKITSDYLDVARIDVRAQLGANISTAEEGKYGYMQPTTLNGKTWYKYGVLDNWIYLMEETDSEQYNRPSPEEGDEIAFDFMVYAENSGTAPSLAMTIRVYFEDGTSWLDPFQLHTIVPVPANAEKRVQFSRTIPQGAYSGKDPVYWECYFYSSTSGTKLYVRDTDVRIRLRGNLIVQGDIEAKNIKLWEGLNVNDQFIVDENGNVTFAGSLEAGVSINSPVINSGEITLVGQYSRLDCLDSETSTQNETNVANGIVKQSRYLSGTTDYLSSSLFDGSLISEVSSSLSGELRNTFNYGTLPYEYKYYSDGTKIMPGLIEAYDVSGTTIKPYTIPRLNGVQEEGAYAYPMYLYADRFAIGKHDPLDNQKGFLIDIRNSQQVGMDSPMITAQDAMHFRLIGDNQKFIEMHNKVRINDNSDLLQLVGTDHCYIEFFRDGTGFDRASYFGFGSVSSDEITLKNEIVSGDIVLSTESGLTLRLNGTTTGGAIQMSHVYDNTTTTSANMFINTTGTLYRSSSARKYKLAEETIDASEAKKVLMLEPKTWYDKPGTELYAELLTREASGEVIDWDNTEAPRLERVPGLVAEDLIDAGLERFVSYRTNEEGTQEVEGVQYDRLPALFIPLLRELFARIEVLENKIEKDDLQ